MENLRDCKHGHFARSCEICDLEKEVEELAAALTKQAVKGGKREGAGRKKEGNKRKGTINLDAELWAKLDRLTPNRSRWVASKIKAAKEKP